MLATVLTNQTSQYTYTWIPQSAGEFEVKAAWLGDSITLQAESEHQTVGVQTAPPLETPSGTLPLGMLLYLVIALSIIVIAAYALHRIRARKSINRQQIALT